MLSKNQVQPLVGVFTAPANALVNLIYKFSPLVGVFTAPANAFVNPIYKFSLWSVFSPHQPMLS
jgi:hypothetical protein